MKTSQNMYLAYWFKSQTLIPGQLLMFLLFCIMIHIESTDPGLLGRAFMVPRPIFFRQEVLCSHKPSREFYTGNSLTVLTDGAALLWFVDGINALRDCAVGHYAVHLVIWLAAAPFTRGRLERGRERERKV